MASLGRTVRRASRRVRRTAGKAARLSKKKILKNAEKALGSARKTLDKKLKKGVLTGLNKLSTSVAKTTGASSLISGVKKFSGVINKAVNTAMKLAKCAKWINNPAFWVIAGALYAARLKGLVKRKKDCYKFTESKKFRSITGKIKIPLASILPCAIEVAFRTPRPR
jgi:hypothetical protein